MYTYIRMHRFRRGQHNETQLRKIHVEDMMYVQKMQNRSTCHGAIPLLNVEPRCTRSFCPFFRITTAV